MNFRNVALSASATVCLALAAFAQIATIEGDVKGTDGQPLQNAEIQITRTDIKGSYKTKTNKKGHYVYMGLPFGGTYNVSVFVNGKEMDSIRGYKTTGDGKPVDFDLRASVAATEARAAEMKKAAETGQVSKDLERSMTPEQKAAMEKQIKAQAEQMKKNKELNDAFNEGLAAMQQKQYEQAAQAFTKASELGPTQLAVWQQLGEAYVKLSEGKTGPEFDATIQKGLDAYKKSIELKPDDPATHNNYALALAKAKKYPEMQEELKKAAELDPANGGKYYYNLGAILVNSGKNEEAGDAFKKAIELTPTYADAYYQYGITLMAKAQIAPDGKVTPVPGTVEAFQKYLELQPNGAYAQNAKDMLTTLSASVDTKYSNPNAKQDTKKSTTTQKKQ
jgi:tetratricopeptide (TPR) repeat protein